MFFFDGERVRLIAANEQCVEKAAIRRRRATRVVTDDLEKRAASVEMLCHMGEVWSSRLAPGNAATPISAQHRRRQSLMVFSRHRGKSFGSAVGRKIKWSESGCRRRRCSWREVLTARPPPRNQDDTRLRAGQSRNLLSLPLSPSTKATIRSQGGPGAGMALVTHHDHSPAVDPRHSLASFAPPSPMNLAITVQRAHRPGC